jgi:hypothetical protein
VVCTFSRICLPTFWSHPTLERSVVLRVASSLSTANRGSGKPAKDLRLASHTRPTGGRLGPTQLLGSLEGSSV